MILACPGPNLRSDCANFLLFGHGKICGLWLSTTVPFRVFSQRIDKQSAIGAGSAATIYIKRNAKHLLSSANRDLQETQLQGMKNPLTPLDIFDLATQSYPRIQAEMKYQVLQFLLDCPQFNRDALAYKDIDSPLFSRLPPVHQLPSGPENITIQFLLGTVNIPEASYEDNSKLIDEWLGQLHLNSPDMKERLGINMLLVWCGDQLTINRLRNLI